MGEFKVHHCKFYHCEGRPVQCMSFEKTSNKLAVARSSGESSVVEVWDVEENWFLEQTMLGVESVESVVWCGPDRLFSAGLHEQIQEYSLHSGYVKATASSYNGSIWCLSVNSSKSHIAHQWTYAHSAGTEDGCVVLFNVLSGDLQYEKALSKQESRILTLAWCDGDTCVVTGGLDNIRVWSVQSGHAIHRLNVGRSSTNINKETVIWSIAVLSDMTIVSGDSRGRVSFWNGRTATLIKSFKSHEADVLTVCVSSDEQSVFASGVDVRLVRFNLTRCLGPNSDWPVWVTGSVKSQHTHDVTSLCYIQPSSSSATSSSSSSKLSHCLVSAGLDCQMIINQLSPANHSTSTTRLTPLTQSVDSVHVIREKKALMIQYDDRVELWKLGIEDTSSVQDGEFMKLSSGAVKILEIKVKKDSFKYNIICSAVSQSLNCICYSDSTAVYLYTLSWNDDQTVVVNRVKPLPSELTCTASRCLELTSDGKILVNAPRILTNTRDEECSIIQLYDMSQSPRLITTITLPALNSVSLNTSLLKSLPVAPVHLMRIDRNDRFVAVARLDKSLHLIKLRSKPSYVTCLPSSGHQITALSFSPNSHSLIVTHSNRAIIEYEIRKADESVGGGCGYSEWMRGSGKALLSCQQWMNRSDQLINVSYHPSRYAELFLVHDHNSFTFINKRQSIPEKSEKSRKRSHNGEKLHNHALHSCSTFKFIIRADMLDDGSLVIVERTPAGLAESFPTAFKSRSKFGL